MSQERTMIKVQKLVKNYGALRAVDGISFEVPSGEVLGFLVPNGAGKSTTMKMLTCYIAPSVGEAKVGGHDVVDASIEVRSILGYLPEDTPLYPDMTTLELLEFAAKLRRIDPGKRTRRIRDIAGVCGLLPRLARPVGELSKGYRQRVGLAQAMIHDPEVLILDEPTSGLDPNQIVEIRELIKEIGKEKTVILSTHILPEVQATCGRVIIINEGKRVADGSPDELANKESGTVYHLVVDSGDADEVGQVRDKLAGVTGVTKVTQGDGERDATGWVIEGAADSDLRRDIFHCARDNDWVLLEMHRKSVSLEDVFRKLTTE